MDSTWGENGRHAGVRSVVLAASLVGSAWACGETQSEGVSGTLGGTTSAENTPTTDGATGSTSSSGGAGSEVSSMSGGTSDSVSDTGSSGSDVGSLGVSGGSMSAGGSSSSGDSSLGGTGGLGGNGSSVADAAVSLTAEASTGTYVICANGGRATPLCLTDEEMEIQARYGIGRQPLDPPRSDEDIAAAWDEQGCLRRDWVGSPCCNQGIQLVGRLGELCCYITCEEQCCTSTTTHTTGGL